MPSKKRKYNARFPPSRIKKIMQTDEEVGKIAQAVPIIISKTLELFVHSLLTKTEQVTNTKQAKTLSPIHMKQCIFSEPRFDFLRDIVKNVADATATDENTHAHTENSYTVPLQQSFPLSTATPPTVAPKISAVTSKVSKGGSSCTKVSSRRCSNDKGSKSKVTKPVETNETVFTCNVPNDNKSVASVFNVNAPNFYKELNSTTGVDIPSYNLLSDSVSKFDVNLDEDYDT